MKIAMRELGRLLIGLVIGVCLTESVVFGGSIEISRIIRSNQIFPEYFYMGSGAIDFENIYNARVKAASQVTNVIYTAGWEAKGMDHINFSRTLSEFHWDVFWPAVPSYGAGIQALNAWYTVDLRSYNPADGFRMAIFELKWNYGDSPCSALPKTYYVPLQLGQVSQVQCTFCPGWYQGILPNDYQSLGYTWKDPEIILGREVQDHQPKKQSGCYTVVDPIYVDTGNVSLDETDLSIPTPNIPLDFHRTYGSMNDRAGILGSRWTHSWDWQVSVSNTVLNGVTNEWLVLRRGDKLSFKELNTPTNSGDSAHASQNGFQWRAITNSDGSWTVSMAGGLVASFGTNGILSRLADSWSNAVQIVYSNQFPVALQHSDGKSLTLEYAGNLLSEIKTSNTNLFMRYFYSTNGLLTNATTYADGKSSSTVYHWDEVSHVITQRINAVGTYWCWEYDGQKGTRGWLGTNRWYDTSVSLRTNGAGRTWVTEHRDSGEVVYAWDFNLIFQKPDQISGPMPEVATYESETNGTNIIKLVFCPNNTNELATCESNIYFQALDAEFKVMESAAKKITYPITQNTYDEWGNITLEQVKEYSGMGTETYSLRQMNYDSQDRMTNFGFGFNADPMNFYSIDWDENWQLPSRQTDPEGNVFSFVYTNGVVTKGSVQVSNGVTNETIYVYSTNGLLISVTNANHHALQMAYDNAGNPTSIVYPGSPPIAMAWTSSGYLDEIRMPSDSYDTNGIMVPRTTKLNTDSMGFVNGVTWADGLSDVYYRCPLGVVTSWVDRVGRRTDYGYLPSAKLASVTRYLGEQAVTTRIDYDKQFNVLKITDPLNRVVESYELDNQDRPIKVSNVNSQSMEISYAMGDRVNTIKRFDGSTVSNAYTGDGLLGTIAYPDENVTLGYCRNGLLKTASNPTGTVAFAYNGAGQVLSVSNAVLNGLVSYSVDGLGQATSTVWNGIGITRGYSTGEQLNYVKVPTGEVYLSYSGVNGLLVGVSNAAGLSAEYSYNSMDQVTGIAWRNASGDVIRSWAYTRNGLGFVTDVEKENGEISQYQYDGLDQLATAKQWNAAGELLSDEKFSYDLAGNRVNKDSSGVSVEYSQDSGDWLTSWKVSTTDLVGNIDVYGVSSEAIGTNNRYGRLYVSNDVAVTPDVAGSTFSVSMLPVNLGTQQVVCAIRDVAGNMGYATGTVFLTIVTNGVYGLDPAGCVTNIKYAGNQYSNNQEIKWDSQYRIKEVLTNGVSAEKFGYDALGRRVLTISGGVTNRHVHDGVHVLADTDATNGVLRVYGYGAGIDQLLTMTVYTSGTAKTYYYLTDQLGSVHALADEVGNIVESYRFDAWGKVLGVYGPGNEQLTTSSLGNRFLWQGREYSYKTGLYNFRARWYDPVMGRWLSNDPIGISGGLNQFVFCANNPVMFVDPLGLCKGNIFWSAFGKGVLHGAIGAAVIVGGAAAAIAFGAPAAFVTSALYITGAFGGGVTMVSIIYDPSAGNVGYNLGSLTGAAIVGGASARTLRANLSPPGSPTASSTLYGEWTSRWVDPQNPNSFIAGQLNYYVNFSYANSKGPTAASAAGAVMGAGSGSALPFTPTNTCP